MEKQLSEIATRWNKVEVRIKEVEQISKEARIPAINELRYAGRQLIDALLKTLTKTEGVETNVKVAEQYVRNADHDVTDATLDFIKNRLSRALEQYGLPNVTSHYPYVPEMRDSIARAEKMIREVRGDRTQRDLIYDRVYDEIIEKLVNQYREFEKVEPNLVYDANLVAAELKLSRGFNKIVGIATLFGVAISLFFWIVPYADFVKWFSATQ